MNKVIHRADSRGYADHGWLKSHHTFSFASYYNPERTRFGLLRVLNDDVVAAGRGFGEHPHDNMEIISIPLRGELAHKDSTGRAEVIRQGEVQIMSAGSGLRHSEFNHSAENSVNFLQIWVFPKEKDISPRYDQRLFDTASRAEGFQTVVSPDENDHALWINQDATFNLSAPQTGTTVEYERKFEGNGMYLFVIEGEVEVAGETLGKRDAIGITETDKVAITAIANSEVLLIEVPMN